MLGAGADIASNVARVRDAIADAAVRAQREPSEVTLIAVTKTRPVDALVEVARCGVQHLGENRVQEAAAKFASLRDVLRNQAPTLHLVGHLQTNKAGQALDLFDRIDSVDSLRLAQVLSRRVPQDQQVPVLLEVYVGDDRERPGFRPHELDDVVGQILVLPGLRVEGLMTVAPLGGDARTAFAQVREQKERLARSYPRVHFGVLSMGMSEDFLTAIEEGSTQVRIGTALFGPRPTG
jgi:PLP dependent protein